MSLKKKRREQTLTDKFYERFDLLPLEYRRMLSDGPTMPTTADLDLAWEMAEKDGSLKSLIDRVNQMTPKKKEETPKERRARIHAERMEKLMSRNTTYYRPILGKPQLRNDKHSRLIALVMSEKEMEEALARRNSVADFNVRSMYVRPVVGYQAVQKKKERGDNIMPDKPAAQKPLYVMMHNANGKK